MKALLLENISIESIKIFEQYNIEVNYYKKSLDYDELKKVNLQEYDIIGIRSKTILDKKTIDLASNLKVIGSFCIGTDKIDIDYAQNKGIAIFNSPVMSTRSVAELVIAHIINLSRKVTKRNYELHNGIWNKTAENSNEIRGKTLGIIGYGHVGSQVSILAESMGMNIVFYDIINVMPLGNSNSCNSMNDLLKKSDFITIHVPLTNDTEYLINKDNIKLIKKGSYLLNLSRGKVVELEPLRKAIDDGDIAGCALDVYPEEPNSNCEDWINIMQKANNTILTPHIGGATEEAQINIGIDVSNKIINYLFRGNTIDCINLPNINSNNITSNKPQIFNIHKNVPGVISKLSNIIMSYNCNISNSILSTNENIGICLLSINSEDVNTTKYKISNIVNDIKKLEENIKVSLFNNL